MASEQTTISVDDLNREVFLALVDATTSEDGTTTQVKDLSLEVLWITMATHPNPTVSRAWSRGELVSPWQQLMWLLGWWKAISHPDHIPPCPWGQALETWAPPLPSWVGAGSEMPRPLWLRQLSAMMQPLYLEKAEAYPEEDWQLTEQDWESLTENARLEMMDEQDVQTYWETFTKKNPGFNPMLEELMALAARDPQTVSIDWLMAEVSNQVDPDDVTQAYLDLMREMDHLLEYSVSAYLAEQLLPTTSSLHTTLEQVEANLWASDSPLVQIAMKYQWPLSTREHVENLANSMETIGSPIAVWMSELEDTRL